jgi:quinol-cytochrome oxidoreductase complex cytochrome b subunit
MGQPSYPPLKPPASGSDLAISIAALTITVLLGAVAAVFGLFLLAFLDHCPPESCSAEGAVTAVGTALLIAFVIGVVGLVVTVIQLYRRKRGWPFALATLVLCALAVFLGGVGYAVAVGA